MVERAPLTPHAARREQAAKPDVVTADGSGGAGVPLYRTFASLAILAWATAAPLLAQDPPRPDSLEVLPDSVRDVFADSTPIGTQRFPARLLALRGAGHEVYECDRECVHASTAFSLIELLAEYVPGLTTVRAGFFAGPHHILDGAFGSGFGGLYIDGREILSLERAQTDLRRLSLNYVERIRVFRGADGFLIDVDLIRHDASRAYSRIGGGTGDPRAQVLEGVFANGLGRTINVEGAFELLDVNAGNVENDRFGAFGRLSWMPKSNDFGVQLEFRREAVDRAAADTADVRRNEAVIRARANLGERAQLEAFATTSSYRLEIPGLPDSIAPPQRSADGVGLRLSALPGRGAVTVATRFSGGDAYASVVTDVAAWYPIGPLWLEGGAELASWNEFSTRALRAAVAYSDTLLVPFTLRGFAAAGDRGVGLPQTASADSVGFDAYGVSAALRLGPFDLTGRFSGQRLDRQILFGGFDQGVQVDSSEVDLTSLEVRFEGPVIPLGAILRGVEPIRLRAFWRKNTSTGARALFVPESLARLDFTLHDRFFGDNLDIWLGAFFESRGQRLVPVVGSPDPILFATDTWAGGHFMFKIGDFRFFWRFTNPGNLVVSDIPGAQFPIQVNVFGIRWEFFN